LRRHLLGKVRRVRRRSARRSLKARKSLKTRVSSAKKASQIKRRLKLLNAKLARKAGPKVVRVSLDGISFTTSTGVPMGLRRHWRNIKHGFRRASFKREGAYCALSGYVFGGGNTIARLPAWCRPKQREVFGVYHSRHAQARVDVRPDGVVEFVRYGAGRHLSSGQVSLDSIRFVAHMDLRKLRSFPVFRMKPTKRVLTRRQAYARRQRVRLNAYFNFYYRWWQASRETWWRSFRHQLRLHRLASKKAGKRPRKPTHHRKL